MAGVWPSPSGQKEKLPVSTQVHVPEESQCHREMMTTFSNLASDLHVGCQS